MMLIIFIVFLLLVNLVGFIVVWADKRKAMKNKWRISEKTIYAVAFVGGGLGVVLGMKQLRHKTQKQMYLLTKMILMFNIVWVLYLVVRIKGWVI